MKKDELSVLFDNPGHEYRGKPFWSWNGQLEAPELARQVGVMKEMGLGGYFMHSRAGLITEYLGDDWFELINKTADCGEALGMEAWLYDEDRWPSGSAGGKVTVDPQYRMKSLYVYEMAPKKFCYTEQTFIAFAARLDGLKLGEYHVISSTEGARDLPDGYKILEFRIVPDAPNSNYNGTTYIDTMSRKAVDRFIELTHEQYKLRCGDRLGRSIKGIFTDEPHRGHMMDNRAERDGVISCAVAYTDDIFEEFEKRYGYDAKAILPELFYQKDGKTVNRVKLNYIDLCDNLFLERFMMPINDWCEENGIKFTGHVLHEDSLTNQTVPNGSLMRCYEYMGCPGIDLLTEFNRCYWVVKQLSSAARQLGKQWMLSELYGCTGWQFNLRSHKAVGDWQALFGINMRCQHLSWYTMEGESKRDYPASILHQSPWYHDYSYVETYFARFGALMMQGKPCCEVMVVNPIESIWAQAYLGFAAWISSVSPLAQETERKYTTLFNWLVGNQIDFDYGEEQMIAKRYSIEKDDVGVSLCVGNERYRCVIVGGMFTMRPSTLQMLKEFRAEGGTVVFAGDAPAYIDAVASEEPSEFADGCVRVAFEEEALLDAVRPCLTSGVTVRKADDSAEHDVFEQLRYEADGDYYVSVILNTDRENPKNNITVSYNIPDGYTAEEWNMETGEHTLAPCRYENGKLIITADLYAAGTRAFILTKNPTALPAASAEPVKAEKAISGEFEYALDEENVCVLDFVRFRWAGGQFSEEAEVLKIDGEVRDSLKIEHRGGEMLQPWYAKLHDKKIYGQLELSYDFYIDKLPEGGVTLCGERPEFNEYFINGIRLNCPDYADFYIDNCLKKMPVPKDALREGKNVVMIKVNFMRTTNIEALYLTGDFGVQLYGHKRVLTTLPKKIGFENLINYNMPFYTGCLTYRIPAERFGYVGGKAVLKADGYVGGLVKVLGGGDEKILAWEPYEADITDALKAGEDVFVTLVGTRRNLFGPLHLVPAIHGAYGPGHFVTGGSSWTNDYNLIDAKLGKLTLLSK